MTRAELVMISGLVIAFSLTFGTACTGKSAEDEVRAAEPPEGSSAKSSQSIASSANSDKKADEAGDVSIIKAKTKSGEETEIAVQAPKGWTVMRAPSTPDPHAGKFTLREATEGLSKKGTLVAKIETAVGTITCDLFEQEKPITVANFVGLARGKRKHWDPDALAWVGKPFYDGSVFHRVMPGFMIQGGDRSGNGLGGIGYTIPDEIPKGEKHDRPGLLCMANRNAGFNGSQFFITESPAPHVDGRYTVFGQCAPVAILQRISRAPSSGKPDFKPTTPVELRKLTIERAIGGSASGATKTGAGVVPLGRAVEVNPDGSPKRPK